MKNKYLEKLKRLQRILKKMDSVILAYSGGVDSSFLLKVCKDILGDNVLAVTASSPIYKKEELIQAKRFSKNIGVRHLIIKTDEYKNPNFIKNNFMRCYWCKRELFLKLKRLAKRYKINYVIDGTNYDDIRDFRPGEKAKKELGVRSPLKEAGLKKDEIRYLSKKLRLFTYSYPNQACLSSRIPYGEKITPDKLRRIEKAESFLKKLGFLQVRIRDHDSLARIEVEKKIISSLCKNSSRVIAFFKKLGFFYITVDLEGYRSGSMNIPFRKNKKTIIYLC